MSHSQFLEHMGSLQNWGMKRFSDLASLAVFLKYATTLLYGIFEIESASPDDEKRNEFKIQDLVQEFKAKLEEDLKELETKED